MISGQNSPVAKAPPPLPRPGGPKVAPKLINVNAVALPEQPRKASGREETTRNDTSATVRSRAQSFHDIGIPFRAAIATAPQPTIAGSNDIPTGSAPALDNALPRASSAPAPPPKPKRISLAPQPNAKPLSLQSLPLQPKAEPPVRSMTTPASMTLTGTAASTKTTTSSTPPTTPNSIPSNATSSQDSPKPKLVSTSVHAVSSQPLSPPAKKPRSGEHSADDALTPFEFAPAQQRFRNQSRTHAQALASSPPHSMSMSQPNIGSKSMTCPSTPEKRTESGVAGTNPTLIGARSRLRSTSDAKASTSLAVAVPYSTRTMATNAWPFDDGNGFGFNDREYARALVSPTYPPPQFRRNGVYEDDVDDGSAGTAAAEKLAASLHKIQALAQGQTERMKQINYAEKKADLAEVVHEKSSLWRARGAEWGGIAKKAWGDRGGMGGIAGGIADRWKKRGDGMHDETSEYHRPGVSAIFGIPLEDAVRISKISASTGVPAVVTRCIEYLDVMGVEEVGLYRVSGSTINVARLKAMFDSGHDYDFLQKGNEPQNPHDVATLLKLYLRELPSPIIPVDVMPIFNTIDFSDSNQQPIQKLKDALYQLPLENYILLGTTCKHLSNLADYESYTKMNISNLGVIFCPTLQIGSILFKNLLGGDGSEDERHESLLVVWNDLERRHEEMENLEMIKDFEMGLQFEKNGDRAFRDDAGREHELEREREKVVRENSLGRQSWEEVDRDLLDLSSSPPLQPTSFSSSLSQSHAKGSSGSRRGGLFTSAPLPSVYNTKYSEGLSKARPSEPPLDLYDELMTKELNEATNTPLIDLGDDVESDHQDTRWKRHAREPATNRRTESPPRGVTRHERVPAVSIRL
ncbi:hypothetical protein BGZ58_007814 [Dissophora ornata]|nr:hypothetical protein BGZ58_007814 [Dissophora ornata]